MVRMSKNTLGMLIAKYRSVLLRMIRQEVVVLAVSGLLLAAPAPALAAEYHVGAGHAYATLEVLRTDSSVSFQNGDKIILHNSSDVSLNAPFSLPPGLELTLEAVGGAVLSPASGSEAGAVTLAGGSLTLAPGIILDGFANMVAGETGRGGAVSLPGGGILTARDAVFRNNTAELTGGAIYALVQAGENGAVDVAGSRFEGNRASDTMPDGSTPAGWGGAILIKGAGLLTADGSVFAGNYARRNGGALMLENGAAGQAAAVRFLGNRADGWGGAVNLYQSGLFTADRSVFSGNSALWGGAVNVDTNSVFTANEAFFSGNSADNGGGALKVYWAEATADRAVFSGNQALDTYNDGNGYGGAVHIYDGTFSADGAVFTGNTANSCGGAIHADDSSITLKNTIFSGNSATYGGGAVDLYDSNLRCENVSFINNTAGFGGAISAYAATITLNTDNGATSLFSGNTSSGGGPNYAIFFEGETDRTSVLIVSGGGTLDMRDALRALPGDYRLMITVRDGAVWKLGGNSIFEANGEVGFVKGAEFVVNNGTLDLYRDAAITITKGRLVLLGNGGAVTTLISRGNNTISAPTVTLNSNTILGFDLTDATPSGPARLTLTGTGTGPNEVVSVNPANLNINILALNGSGIFSLVQANGIKDTPTNKKTLTLRGENFANTRASDASLNINGNTLQLTTTAENGVMQWNGGASGVWNATDGNWTGLYTAGVGGVDLEGQTKFLHGDAVLFSDPAGGQIAIQAAGVQVAERPDNNTSGTNSGLTIAMGHWTFTGGALDGGGILFSGDGGIAFDSRVLTQRITVEPSMTASIGAIAGHTLTFSGMGGSAMYGGAICGKPGTVVSLNGNLIFNGNRAQSEGGAIYSDTVTLGGTSSFTANSAGSYGGAIYGNNITFNDGTSSFTGNSAGKGGAIYSNNTVTLGGESSFIANSTEYEGGAIYALSDATLTAVGGNIAFTGNAAGGEGGAVYADENATLTAAGGDIAFSGNTDATGPNALYLNNGNNSGTLTLAAKSGRSILFYDPIASDSTSTNLTITINPDADDSGAVRLDTHQSAVYGSTTVGNGTLALTGGASYGAAANTGSFTLAAGARLSADAAGGTVNAGDITLKGGSTTAVDISDGKLLTVNGNITINNGAALDLTGYSASPVDAVTSSNAISGNFTTLKIGGMEQTEATPALDKFINSIFLGKTNNGKTITVKQGGLVWNNTDTGTAHGTFNVATEYTLGAILADNNNPSAHGFGWDGKTLTKEGAGNITLTAANTYTGGTLLNAGTLSAGHDSALGSGSLTMADGTTLCFTGSHSLANAVTVSGVAAVNSDTGLSSSLTGVIGGSGSLAKTGGGSLTLTGANTYSGGTVISDGRVAVNGLHNLGSGSITNNAELYFAPNAAGKQTIDFANRYSGIGTIGLNASLTAGERWSDLIQFANAPQDNVDVYFSFTANSDLQYLPAGGLHFAKLENANGNDGTFGLAGTTLAGAKQLAIKTIDNQNYYLNAAFNSSAAKVYSETAAGTLGQAAGLHGQEIFKNIGQAVAGAAGGETGVYAGMGRGDVRHNSGSHADVKGNNFALALAWENGDTTWGLIGQRFDGSYTTTHTASVGGAAQSIRSAGDLKQSDFGLFAECRPDDSGRYWQGLVKAGNSQNDFKADNANGGSRFRSDRSVFGLSIGGGFVKETAPNRSLETYQHLIYTRLSSDRVTDSIGQDIRFDSDDSVRLLAGARWTLECQDKSSFYAGAAVDYEFRGKTGATIDGSRADGADLQGLTGILEMGFSAKQSETLTIDGAFYGYIGKKEGIIGSLTLSKKF